MKSIALTIVLVFSSFILSAQNQVLHWAKSFASVNSNYSNSLAIDQSKNVYTTGSFQGTTDFDPGSGTYTLAPTTAGYDEIFVSKLDSNGTFVWAKSFGSTSTYDNMGKSIAVDSNGDIYVAGIFSGAVDFDPGPGVHTLWSSSNYMFVLKLDGAGNFLWAVNLGPTMSYNLISLTTAPSGNVVITGLFTGTFDFNPGPGVNNLTSNGTADIFVLSLDQNGSYIWAKQFGSGGVADFSGNVRVDLSGNIYLTGSYQNSMDVDPGTGAFVLTAQYYDAYVIKWNSAGDFVWAKNIGGSSIENGNSIDVDQLGNVTVVGSSQSPQLYSNVTQILTSNGGFDAFVVKYDVAGNLLWAQNIGGTGSDYCNDVICDNSNNIYLVGTFSGPTDFDFGPSTYSIAPTYSNTPDAFILKLNPSGNFLSAKNLRTTDLSMTIDDADNMYMTGTFGSVTDLDPGPNVYNLYGTSPDVFVSKVGTCLSLPSPLNTTAVSAQTVCAGKTTTLSATCPQAIYWYNSTNLAVSIGSGPNFITSPLPAGTYTFFATNSASCVLPTLQTPVTLTVMPTPVISVASGSICSGQSFTFSPNGAATYVFTGGSAVVSPTANTSYTVLGTSANGCTNTAVASVSVSQSPTFTVTTTPAFICPGKPSNLAISGAPHVLWFNGSTSTPVTVTPTVTTTYSVTAYNSNYSCSTVSLVTVTVDTPITLTVTGSNTTCIGSTAAINVTGGVSYLLSPFPTYTTSTGFVVTPTVTTTYTVSGSSAAGCSYSATHTISVNNSCTDVWPGDANSDGTADNLDVLELGLHYTQTGPARATASNNWQSYFSNNWAGTITNGKNLNHSDCNGDGTINANDTLAIYNNYGLTHAFRAGQANILNPELSIVPDQPAVASGAWGTASIYLGDASNPQTNVNGIAFTIDFDHTLIETNSIYVEYENSFLSLSGQNLNFRKLVFGNGKIYTATTHTNNTNVSGHGKIATLHYQIKSTLTTDQVLNVGLSQANQSSAIGNLTPLTSGTATLMAMGSSVGINELSIESLISISPNPANTVVSITSTSDLEKVEVISLTGQVLISESAGEKTHRLNVESLANGVYFIKAYTSSKQVVLKNLVIQK